MPPVLIPVACAQYYDPKEFDVSISRRRFLATSSVLLAAMPARRLLAQQPAAATPPPETAFQTIRRNVGCFTGRGGTIGWLSTPEALVVVDTQHADTAAICLDGLPGRAGRTIDRVFNTHHHADHTGGNGVFRKVSTRIVAQTNVPGLQRTAYAASKDPQVYADSTFDTTWSETVGKERVTASFRGPGHTGGDSIIHFEHAEIVHLADLLWIDVHPFVDRPGGASIENWMRILEQVSTAMSAGTTYIAGHAQRGLPVTADRKALARQRDYFDAALTHARAGIAAGKSRDEIVALPVLRGFESYQALIPRLSLAATLGAAYDELTSAPRQ